MQLEFIKGNLFSTGCQVLVLPVAADGAWQSDLAMEFRRRFKRIYERCKARRGQGHFQPGHPWLHLPSHAARDQRLVLTLPTERGSLWPWEFHELAVAFARIAVLLVREGLRSLAIPFVVPSRDAKRDRIRQLFEAGFGTAPVRIEVYAHDPWAPELATSLVGDPWFDRRLVLGPSGHVRPPAIEELRLYHMTSVKNVRSIAEAGLMSRRHPKTASRINEDIAEPSVICIRETTLTPDGQAVTDFVPLYYNPRNAMQAVRQHIELALLCFSGSLTAESGVWLTDRNAARRDACYSSDPKDLAKLDWDRITADSRADGDQMAQMAEVLVPRTLAWHEVESVFVRNRAARERVVAELGGLRCRAEVRIEPRWFFNG